MADFMADNGLKPIIDLTECLYDSPKFRLVLEQNENDLNEFEAKADKVVKLCSVMVDIGKSFIKAKSNFINGIYDILVYFKDDPLIVKCLNRFVQTLTELLKYDQILLDQANRAVARNLSNFMRDDICKVKETKRHFDKISDEYDSVLNRHSQVAKNKPVECEEAANLLTATRSCFQHLSLDYVTQLSVVKSKKRHEVLDSILSLMHAYGTHFHQGSDLFQDFDHFKKDTATHIIDMRNTTNTLEKQLESRHTLVTAREPIPKLIRSERNGAQHIRLEGYLFKRTTNAFKTWNRRWFIIQDHQLVYQKRSHDPELTIMENDLRLCTAKPVQFMERRFCFEVLSPSKSHILQADSEEGLQTWISAMQAGIDAAYHSNDNSAEQQSLESQDSWCTASSASNKSSTSLNLSAGPALGTTPPAKPPRMTHTHILGIAGNDQCCDCGATDPKWASINLGITLCIECSGIHRSLGVHQSKVRSLNLDAWDHETVRVMSSLGNALVNKVYEAKVDESVARRATPDCGRTQRELWIKAKYVQKAFVDKSGDDCNQSTGKDVKQEVESVWTDCSDRPLDQNFNVNKSENSEPKIEQNCDQTDSQRTSELLNVNNSNQKVGNKASETDSEDEDSEETQLIVSDIGVKPCIEQKCDLSHQKLQKPPDSGGDVQKADPRPPSAANESQILFYNHMLYKAALECDLKSVCEALAKGAQINWHNEDDQKRTPLHQAILSDTNTVCEYLMLNGAKANVADANGTTPLHMATHRGNTGGADQKAADNEGNNALTIAINNANADIVTLLRLAKLNEEMRNDEEFGNIDETFNEVVRDFSQMASNSPEKLKRNTIQQIE